MRFLSWKVNKKQLKSTIRITSRRINLLRSEQTNYVKKVVTGWFSVGFAHIQKFSAQKFSWLTCTCLQESDEWIMQSTQNFSETFFLSIKLLKITL